MKKYKDRDSYISYCLTLDGDTLRDALQDLCKEAGVADCTVFLSAGGLPYTLRYLTSQIYLNNKPINHCVRAKANILNIIHDAHLEEMSSSNYYSLKRLYKQSDNSYYKEKYKGMLIKLEIMIREEINAFLGDEIKCRKCGAILGPLWHGWELCDTCGYRFNVDENKSPDNK